MIKCTKINFSTGGAYSTFLDPQLNLRELVRGGDRSGQEGKGEGTPKVDSHPMFKILKIPRVSLTSASSNTCSRAELLGISVTGFYTPDHLYVTEASASKHRRNLNAPIPTTETQSTHSPHSPFIRLLR